MKSWRWVKRILLASLTGLGVIILLSVIVYLVSGNAAASQERIDVDPEEAIAPALLQEDLAFLFETLEAVHPNLYAALDKEESATQQAQVAAELTEALTPAAFFQKVAPLVMALEDGHTSVSVPGAGFSRFRKEGGTAFPFSIAYREGSGLTVRTTYAAASGIDVGDQLMLINGHDADSLYQVFRSYFSGKRLAFRNRRTDRQFRGLLWMHGIEPPYNLVYTSASSPETQTVVVDGVTRDEVLRQDSLRGPTQQERYTYTLLPEGIGYLDFRSMQGQDAFADFLEKTFTQVEQEAPKGIIIDLRNNGGGNSRLGNQLLDYLIDQPYVMMGGKAWRMSAQYKQVLRDRVPGWLGWISEPPMIWLIRLAIEDARIMTVDDGEVVMLEGGEIEPEDKALRYKGKVCFLIGPGTFSSAMMLANAVEDNDLAVLIGSETGGIPNHYGELYGFQLPHTGLYVYVSSAQFIRANGAADDTNGVLPDIPVQQTDTDTKQGMDTVLEAAKAWILG